LRELARTYELLFVPQCTYREGDDRVEARELVAALAGTPDLACHAIESRHAPAALMRVYETADATLAIRLHGAVFSALAGVPPATLAYLPKVSAFLESVGLADLALPLEGLDAGAIVEAVARSRTVDGGALRQCCGARARELDGYVRIAGDLLEIDRARRVA
jgi:polysaccharide pyruvyl transferase WcaK-like protein